MYLEKGIIFLRKSPQPEHVVVKHQLVGLMRKLEIPELVMPEEGFDVGGFLQKFALTFDGKPVISLDQ